MSNNVSQPIPVTSYGDVRAAELTPLVQLIFNYTVDNTELNDNTVTGSGSVTQSDAMAVVSTGTTSSSTAMLQSVYHARYRAGMGGLIRFTTLFSSGVANTEQYIGLADEAGSTAAFKNGLMVGYDGATFGFHRFVNDSKVTVNQTDFNIDKLDGTGPSLMTIDLTKINVWAISFQYLGGGAITLSVEDSSTGDFVDVHKIYYANNNTTPSVYNPNYHLTIWSNNGSTTTDMVCKSASMAYFIEGTDRYINIQQPLFSTGTYTVSGVTSEIPFFTIRNKSTYAGKSNFIDTVLEMLSCSMEATSSNNQAVLRLVYNATLSGSPSYSDINANNSVTEIDIAATGLSGGVEIATFLLAGKNDKENQKLNDLEVFLHEGDTLTIAVSSNNSATFDASLLWKELF